MKRSQFSISVLRDSFSKAMNRFPLALSAAFLFAALSIYLIEYDIETGPYPRMVFSLAIALPLMIGLHLIAEYYLSSKLQKVFLFVAGIIFLIFVFYYIAPDFDEKRMQRPVRFFSFFLMAHLLISIAPFFKKNNIKDFWEFNKDVLVIWCVAAFFTIVIHSGLSIALVAVDNLFDIDIHWKWYMFLFIVMSSCFHPIYLLSNIPTQKQEGFENIAFTKLIRTISLYILIPLTILYFFIVYAYGLKILVSWELPKGWVSSLILGFSALGLVSYFLNFQLAEENGNKLSVLFKKYFFYILTPLVILLFIAIFRRLSDYGFTPPRYFILITGVWLLLCCLYFIISKTDDIKRIPYSLILFLLFGTMSPWDAFRTSSSSQYSRLIHMLEKNNALENGKLIADLSSLQNSDKKQIREIFYVLNELGTIGNINTILDTPAIMDTVATKDQAEFLMNKIGLVIANEFDETNMVYLSRPELKRIDIQGFNWMNSIRLNTSDLEKNLYLPENSGIIVQLNENDHDTIYFGSLVRKLNEANKGGERTIKLDTFYDVSTPFFRHQLYIEHLNYQKLQDKLQLDYLDAVLLSGKR